MKRKIEPLHVRYVRCRGCGQHDETHRDPITLRKHTGTATTMRCRDCAGPDGCATLCRACCPTGHGTRFPERCADCGAPMDLRR